MHLPFTAMLTVFEQKYDLSSRTVGFVYFCLGIGSSIGGLVQSQIESSFI